MVKAKLLNSDASLNNFVFLGAAEFVPGENLKIAIQIFLSEKNIRYIPPADAELTLTFIDKDGADIVKTGALIDEDDRSMWFVEFAQEETEVLQGQNIEGLLDINGDESVIYKFLMANVVQRINLADDC